MWVNTNDDALVIDRLYLEASAPKGNRLNEVGRYSFKRHGDYWSVAFGGEAFQVKHSKGLEYISYLLVWPGRKVPAVEAFHSGVQPMGALGAGQGDLVENGLSVTGFGDAGPVIDEQAQREYWSEIQRLRGEIGAACDNNDLERAARLEEEKETLVSHLSAAVGLGGRGRTAGSAVERARTTVSQGIARALKRLEPHDAALSRYLKTTIRKGTFFSYDPPDLLPWETGLIKRL